MVTMSTEINIGLPLETVESAVRRAACTLSSEGTLSLYWLNEIEDVLADLLVREFYKKTRGEYDE